jgi:hypothetical protein
MFFHSEYSKVTARDEKCYTAIAYLSELGWQHFPRTRHSYHG